MVVVLGPGGGAGGVLLLPFLADVRRVVENAWMYNEKDSEVAVKAREVWEWVEGVVGGLVGAEVGKAVRLLGVGEAVKRAMVEWSRREVVQCLGVLVSGVDPYVKVGWRRLPGAVVRRLGRRMGRPPNDWHRDWLAHATSR